MHVVIVLNLLARLCWSLRLKQSGRQMVDEDSKDEGYAPSKFNDPHFSD
jgi:hypothetical protein